MTFLGASLFIMTATQLAFGQAGDRAGADMRSRVPAAIIPAAPPLSPEAEMRTFRVQDGFRVELVASEPLVESPIAIQFGPDGRLWVLEMRGFMPNVDGTGETEPIGRISVLEDLDRDGRMDRSTVFLDRLVMPRAFMLLRDGVLVAEPPMLWFHRDTDGDGAADARVLLSDSYAVEADPLLGSRANPEHSANSLTWALDNWIYSANYATRFRNTSGVWEFGATISRGQWGLTQDDSGRLFYNTNSDQLRGDLVPAEYLSRNPNFSTTQGANFRVGISQEVWPGRINPGVNRGYQDGILRGDFTLANFTAACAPLIYRGNLFPAAFLGNAFICEPAGNLVRRGVIVERDGGLYASNAYSETEFLVSTDERFRPVNLAGGPDGALYVVDMYRGILQHRNYVTTYLREQILSRELEDPVNLGRIFRIVPEAGASASTVLDLDAAPSATLVGHLSHPNGWWRDTAQRLLVERADLSAAPALRTLAASGASPLGRIHALWTLDGLGQPDASTILEAMRAPDPQVRVHAARVSERLLGTAAAPALLAALMELAGDGSIEVQRQAALSLGQVPDRIEGIDAVLRQHHANPLVRDPAITSLTGRELEMIERIATDQDWMGETPAKAELVGLLSRAVFVEGREDRIVRLLDLAAGSPAADAWRQAAILNGIAGRPAGNTGGRAGGGGRGAGGGGRGGGRGGAPALTRSLSAEPAALVAMRLQNADQVVSGIAGTEAVLLWPGKPGAENVALPEPLTAAQEASFQMGRNIYATTCGACHQLDGRGRDGLAPALANSEWTTGSTDRAIRIVLHGVTGPITAAGQTFQGDMPPMGALDDAQLASILTYIRRAWGHTADPVEPGDVAAVRAATAGRASAWTVGELNALP
jgi:putative membrane-bound dehydrogenase-like protein